MQTCYNHLQWSKLWVDGLLYSSQRPDKPEHWLVVSSLWSVLVMFTLSLGYASRRRISGLNIELPVNFKFSRPPAMLALALLLSSFFHIVGVPRTWPSPSSHPARDRGVFLKDQSETCVIIINHLLSVFRMPKTKKFYLTYPTGCG